MPVTSCAWRLPLLLAALVFTAPAAAAPLGERPFERVPGGSACLAPTGAPGELSRRSPRGAEVLVAAAGGLGRPTVVPLGPLNLDGCPRVVSDAGGAAVAAGATAREVRVALREPGGTTFGAPVTVASARDVFELSVAVSPRGDAIVAWTEWQSLPQRIRVRVARRVTGGAFGAPEELVPWRAHNGVTGVQVGLAPDGEAVVVVRDPVDADQPPHGRMLALSARAGEPFGAPADLPATLGAYALGVGPDGRALLAASQGSGAVVLERAPGGAFGAPQTLADGVHPDHVAVAFGVGGRAVVAWNAWGEGTTGAALRNAATGFAPAVTIVPPPRMQFGPSAGADLLRVRPLPLFGAALAPDGRASVAWLERGRRLVLATVAGRAVVERQRFGGALRVPEGVSPLTLAGGRRALAWTNRDQLSVAPTRVHLAVEGASAVRAPATPRVTVAGPRRTALRPVQTLSIPIRCSAACDLTVQLGKQTGFGSVPRAGTANVRILGATGALRPGQSSSVPLVVRSSAPGSRDVARTAARVQLRRLPMLPFPRLRDVRARRLSGDRVEVTWRTTRAARETAFFVTASSTRGADREGVYDIVIGSRRRSYRVVLENTALARWVRVELEDDLGARKHTVTVPLR
ncbi:hypothetical protein OJ998_13395 [Solirubrobacter taibaiensis]|nr:hypothetical protein [Solirubrobacter taibaiensis]